MNISKSRVALLFQNGILAFIGLKKRALRTKHIADPFEGRPNPIHLWNDDVEFNKMMEPINNTLVDKVRCFMLYQFSNHVGGLKGDIAEIGVYKGGTAKLFSQIFEKRGKKIYLFDTFSGMPPTDSVKDLHKEGDFNDTSLEAVKQFLRGCNNVVFYKGFFPDTAKPIMDKTFCLVHIDVDIYKSVMDCCSFFYPRMISGGIMVYDDYGFLSCPGAKSAVDEFFRDKPESPCYLPTGQCLVIKL